MTDNKQYTHSATGQMISFAFLMQEGFKKWSMTRSLFVVMTIAAVVAWSPVGDNIKDIWNSPGRIEAIEADVNRINESLAMYTEDENRVVTLNDQ